MRFRLGAALLASRPSDHLVHRPVSTLVHARASAGTRDSLLISSFADSAAVGVTPGLVTEPPMTNACCCKSGRLTTCGDAENVTVNELLSAPCWKLLP